MKLESAAQGGTASEWDFPLTMNGGVATLSSRMLMAMAMEELADAQPGDERAIRNIAASFQYNLARGIARIATDAASREGMRRIALSGGVAYNQAIRETIRTEIIGRGFGFVTNTDYPLGDGCVSYGQCVYAGMLLKKRG